MKRRLLLGAVTAAVALFAALQYWHADRYRERIHQALEHALHRKVDITGPVTYGVWHGPAFSIADVVIHEDPSVGLEPFAYVASLDATISLTAMLRGRLEISSLVLDEPQLNLVKQDSGSWNLRLLLRRTAPEVTAQFPEIKVRSGRINLKFGDTKSVLYLANADFDLSPGSGSGFDLRFSAEPARTDRPSQGFGTLRGRGRYLTSGAKPGDVDLEMELDRSALSEIVTLLQGRGAGVRGFLASRATVRGPLNALKIEGSARLEDIQRWDLLSAASGNWPVRYRGTLDFPGGELDLVTQSEGDAAPVNFRLRAHNLLDDPSWGAIASFNQLPVTALRNLFQYLSVSLPENVSVEGKLSGVLGYSPRRGLQGMADLPEATVKGAVSAFRLEGARFTLDGERFRLEPATLSIGEDRTIEIEGSYHPLAQSFTWRTGELALPVSDFLASHKQWIGGLSVPLLDRVGDGDWSGTLHYEKAGEDPAQWSGRLRLSKARVAVDGLASPVVLESATVSLAANSVGIDAMQGAVAGIEFTGQYQEIKGPRPDRLRLVVDELDLAALQQLLQPSLKRGGGLLGRLSFRTTPAPEWLRNRHLDSTIEVGSLWIGDAWLGSLSGALAWNGAVVELGKARWEREEASASGKVRLRLTQSEPEYRLTAEVKNLPWKSGTIDGEGSADTSGTGALLLRNLKCVGRFTGQGIAIEPEDFRSVSGGFEFSAPRGAPVLKLMAIEASSGAEIYTGQGISENDGRISVDLSSATKRRVRMTGTLWPFELELK